MSRKDALDGNPDGFTADRHGYSIFLTEVFVIQIAGLFPTLGIGVDFNHVVFHIDNPIGWYSGPRINRTFSISIEFERRIGHFSNQGNILRSRMPVVITIVWAGSDD